MSATTSTNANTDADTNVKISISTTLQAEGLELINTSANVSYEAVVTLDVISIFILTLMLVIILNTSKLWAASFFSHDA